MFRIPRDREKGTVRAPRFNIGLPFFFRRKGERVWLEGTTENISRTGVLFRTPRLVERQMAIEMRFSLPEELSGRPAALVVCRGYVVRVVPAPTSHALPGAAATIARYRILRPDAG